jgi:hypothetical protein
MLRVAALREKTLRRITSQRSTTRGSPEEGAMNIACADETVVATVRAVLLEYGVAQVRQQGPNFGNPMIWVLATVPVIIGNDKERAARRAIARIAGATIYS